ncbi:LuxR C-terminal-related transcriptional regulator [Kitasatospora aburaviensis]
MRRRTPGPVRGGCEGAGERTGRRERAEGPPLSWWCGGDPADDGTGTGIGIGTGTATGRDERDGRDEHDGRDGRGQRADRADSPEAARARYAGLLGQQNAHLVAQAVIALTETGRYWQAHGLARAIAADHSQDSWEWNEYLYARGLLRLATGEPAAALADLLECGRRQSERQVLSPIVTPWRSTAADCHTLLGEPGPAVALAEEELALARTWGTPRTVGRALRALAAATGGRHGLDLAAESVGLLRGAEVEVELIPALITYGRLLTEGGRRGAARRALREAASRAERLGTVRLRGVAVDALRASGARLGRGEHAGAEALTDSELRICRLAVAGHSNAEIAAMLHLALRTVETHLTNSFRKLGVRRRVELAGVLEGERRPTGRAGSGRRGPTRRPERCGGVAGPPVRRPATPPSARPPGPVRPRVGVGGRPTVPGPGPQVAVHRHRQPPGDDQLGGRLPAHLAQPRQQSGQQPVQAGGRGSGTPPGTRPAPPAPARPGGGPPPGRGRAVAHRGRLAARRDRGPGTARRPARARGPARAHSAGPARSAAPATGAEAAVGRVGLPPDGQSSTPAPYSAATIPGHNAPPNPAKCSPSPPTPAAQPTRLRVDSR